MRVHTQLGPGLLESAYQQCLAYELTKSGIDFIREKALPLVYEEIHLEAGYRVDFWIEDHLIVELKAVDQVAPIHLAQVLTYLKLADQRYGLLINFNVLHLKDGIRRIVNGY